MANVVIDAMVAEAVRSAGPEFAGDLQSLSWSSIAVALPFLQPVSCMFVEDSPKGFQSAIDGHKYVDNQSAVTAFSEKDTGEALRYEGTRRRKGTRKNNEMRQLAKRTEANEQQNGSINSSLSLSLRSAFFSLCTAFKQPTILRMEFADKYMVLWGSALVDAINQFKMMPFLILSRQLCPPGIEVTLFALFMSINNLGSTLGSFLGAALASGLNISTAQFDNLALGLGVQLIGTLLPIGFVFPIPKEVTGLTS
ncbi:hypothetical protein U9M48_021870 [Paspalum notatum var. saurae]|uniref:Uncharacterized protein n=1 Tax=Paspalum notatum var. saurae TaxID=547442 RepID=A0AAQ3TJY5_PASNO